MNKVVKILLPEKIAGVSADRVTVIISVIRVRPDGYSKSFVWLIKRSLLAPFKSFLDFCRFL